MFFGVFTLLPSLKMKSKRNVLVRVAYAPHTIFNYEQVVRLSKHEDVRGGDVRAVLELELDVVDAAHVEGGGRLPDSSLRGEGEDVHVPVGDVGPLHDRLRLAEEHAREVVRKPTMSVQTQRGTTDRIGDIPPDRYVGVPLEREVEGVLVSDGEAAAVGHPVGGADEPREAVGGVVEVELDLVGGGSGAGDGVHLALRGGDEVLVLNGGEGLALLDVKVDVGDEELGVHVGGDEGGSRGGVDGDLVLGESPEVAVHGVGVLVDDAAALGQGAEGHLDLDLVVGEGDERDGEAVLHEVLVEPERQRHVQGAGHRRELDHVLLDVRRVRELTDLLAKTGTGALGHLLPEEHPLRVQRVHLGTTDLDLDLRDDGVSDGVHPVRGLVRVSHGVARSVQHGGRRLDGGKTHLEHDVRHEVTVARHVRAHLLAETNRARAEVVLLDVLREVSVALVHRLEQRHVRVAIEVLVLAAHGGNLNDSSSTLC